MPKRPSNDWHEPFLTALAQTRNVEKSASSVGVKRLTACRHYRKDAAFAARWDTALRWQTAFLESLSKSGNVTLSARSAGISRRTAYKTRQNDPDFAAEWDEALWEGVETLEGLALEHVTRSMNGSMLKFLISSARARLGPDPLAPAAGSRPLAPARLSEPLTYTDANGAVRLVSDWLGGAA